MAGSEGLKLSALLPKVTGGSVHMEWKKCGKESCRCTSGALHGPYFTLHRRNAGRQTKRYVHLADLAAVIAAIADRKARTTDLSQVHNELREFKNASS